MKAVCKPRVFPQLLDCSAAQAVTFETTTRHDKGTSPNTGDARPVYTTVIIFQGVMVQLALRVAVRQTNLGIQLKTLKEELHLCMQALCMQVTMVAY